MVFDRQIYQSGSVAGSLGTLPYSSSGFSGKKTSYQVRKGDSLWKIARRYHLQVVDLQRWNGLGRSTAIKPGQVLKLTPAGSIKRKRSGVVKTTKKRVRKEVVTLRKGDSLWRISRRYRVSVADLERWNRLQAKTILQPGQRLVLYR